MLQPIHTPLPGGDRITRLRRSLFAQLSPALLLTTLGVRRYGAVEALVIVHLPDGGRETIGADQARQLARDLRADPLGTDREADWAVDLDEAAEAAERQASAILLGMGAGAWSGVAVAREFGGAR